MSRITHFISDLIPPFSSLGLALLAEVKNYIRLNDKKDLRLHIVRADMFILPTDLNNNNAFSALEIIVYLDNIKYKLTINEVYEELRKRHVDECNYEHIFRAYYRYKKSILHLSSFVILGYRNENNFDVILAEI